MAVVRAERARMIIFNARSAKSCQCLLSKIAQESSRQKVNHSDRPLPRDRGKRDLEDRHWLQC